MAKSLKIDPSAMTLAAFQALGPERGRPAGEMGKDDEADIAALAREYGPQRPAFLCTKGRPRKGTLATPVQPRVIKMSPAFWETMGALAEESGLTLHAAMRQALVKWAQDHTHPRAG